MNFQWFVGVRSIIKGIQQSVQAQKLGNYLADISVYFISGPVTELSKNPEIRPIYGGGKTAHIII